MIYVIILIIGFIIVWSVLDDKYTEYLGSPLVWTLEFIWLLIWITWFFILKHSINIILK